MCLLYVCMSVHLEEILNVSNFFKPPVIYTGEGSRFMLRLIRNPQDRTFYHVDSRSTDEIVSRMQGHVCRLVVFCLVVLNIYKGNYIMRAFTGD